jgi:hypothetical protein
LAGAAAAASRRLQQQQQGGGGGGSSSSSSTWLALPPHEARSDTRDMPASSTTSQPKSCFE